MLYRTCLLLLLFCAVSAAPAWAGSTTRVGRLAQGVGDDFNAGRTEHVWFLEDLLDGRLTRLYFDGAPPGILRAGAVVSVRGRPHAGGLLFEALDEDGTGSGTGEVAPAAPGPSGTQSTLVLLGDFDDAALSCSRDHVDALMFSDPADGSVDDFYREATFGAIGLAGRVEGPFPLGSPSTGSCDIAGWADALEAAARDAGVSPDGYDRRLYVIPRQNTCGWAGLGQVGGRPSRAWIFRCGSADVYAHELGHNLGLGHASTPTNEYGDTSDVMGGSGFGLRHFNAPHKAQAAWLPPGDVADVAQSGTYELAALELDGASAAAPRALRIAKPDTNDFYYLSYREPLGFDQNLAWTYQRRLTLHRYAGDGSASRTYLLDTLANGESFVDDQNGLVVTQLGQVPGLVTVQVQMGGTCTTAEPAVQVDPPAQAGRPGDTFQFQVSLTNQDGPGCAPVDWQLARQVPAGWQGSVTPERLTLAPGASGQALLTVGSEAAAEPASYAAAAVVWDGAAPERLSSRVATITLEDEVCASAAPAMALLPAAYVEDAGQTLSYHVALENRDGAACGPSDFVLAGEVPSGWTGSVSPGELQLGPGESGSATFHVTVPDDATPGSHAVAVAASDPSDPGHGATVAGVWQVPEPADVQPPSAPANLVADEKRKHVHLSWQPASDDVGVTGYRVLRNGVSIASTSDLRLIDRPASGSYSYAVVAYDAAGNESAPSNAVAVTILGSGGR